MKKDCVSRTIASLQKKASQYHRAAQFVTEIPLHTPIHIVYEKCSVSSRGRVLRTDTVREDNEMVVIPKTWTSNTLACSVIAVEKKWWKVVLDRVNIDAIKIKSWKPFSPDDAGLYINWETLTEEFRAIAFGHYS